jgi:transposase-like protein
MKESKRGGARPLPDEEKKSKIQKVLRLLNEGYGIEIACKRAGTASNTIRKWARELSIPFSSNRTKRMNS